MRTILLVTTRKAAGRHVCCLELIVDIAKKKKKQEVCAAVFVMRLDFDHPWPLQARVTGTNPHHCTLPHQPKSIVLHPRAHHATGAAVVGLHQSLAALHSILPNA